MHIEPDLKLYQQSGENMGANRFLIDISSSWFIQSVLVACWMLQRFIDPDSKSYKEPKQYFGDDYDDDNASFLCANFIGANARSSFSMARTAWSGLPLIHAYVEWRNNAHPSIWIVGEDHTTHIIVYNTLALLHNYNVARIEDTHAKSGRTFGSATSFQKKSPMANVVGWPDLFSHVGRMPDLKTWPCDRPNYVEQDPNFDRMGQRRTDEDFSLRGD